MIKVCINPQCDEVLHNTPAKATRCPNCDMRLVAISEKCYQQKYAGSIFQFDYLTGDPYRPAKQAPGSTQLQINI